MTTAQYSIYCIVQNFVPGRSAVYKSTLHFLHLLPGTNFFDREGAVLKSTFLFLLLLDIMQKMYQNVVDWKSLQDWQELSIRVNSCQFVSIYVNSCQFMSIRVNLCQFVSILVNSCQFLSILVNPANSFNLPQFDTFFA